MDYFNGISIVDTEGTVQERYGYSAFGVRRVMAPDFSARSSSDFDWEFGFQGQFLDLETGWMNYGYRYYVPWLGRWPNRDPIGENGGVNLYAILFNDLVNALEFLGLWKVDFIGEDWSADQKSYFNDRLSYVAANVPKMIERTEYLIRRAESISESCCFRDKLINSLSTWKRLLLESMDRRLDSNSLILPVGMKEFADSAFAKAYFPFRIAIGNELYNFTKLVVNPNTFFTDEDEANSTLFHELSHISGTVDWNGESAASSLWNANIVERWITNPSEFVPTTYFNLLKEESGTTGCSESDRMWPQ